MAAFDSDAFDTDAFDEDAFDFAAAASSSYGLLSLTTLVNITNLQGDALVIALLFLGSL